MVAIPLVKALLPDSGSISSNLFTGKFAALWKLMDTRRDTGAGPLRRCASCQEMRHDIDDADWCTPCSMQIW